LPADENIVDRYVNQLDQVPNDAHYQETRAHGLRDLDELAFIGLRTPVDEECTVSEEVARNLSEIGECFGHLGGRFSKWEMRRYLVERV